MLMRSELVCKLLLQKESRRAFCEIDLVCSVEAN